MDDKISSIQLQELEKGLFKIKKLCKDGLQICSCPFYLEIKVKDDVFHDYSPNELNEKAKEAESKFDKVLTSAMEQNRLPQYLNELMLSWKLEAQDVLTQHDNIIYELNKVLDLQDVNYCEKLEKHCSVKYLIRRKMENLITEINKTGKEEICATRDAIIDHSKRASDDLRMKNCLPVEESYADNPFDSYLWKSPSETLPLEQLQDIFLVDQTDIINLRKELSSEVCKQRCELERKKLDHKLKMQILEEEIFYLEQKCLRAMPIVVKMKRKCFNMMDKKENLSRTLNTLFKQIEKERAVQGFKCSMSTNSQRVSKYDFHKILEEKKNEATALLDEILLLERDVFKNILNIPKNDIHICNQDISFFVNMNTSLETKDKYWKQYLYSAPKTSFLHEVLNILYENWEQLHQNYILLQKLQRMSSYNKELKLYLENYYTNEKMME